MVSPSPEELPSLKRKRESQIANSKPKKSGKKPKKAKATTDEDLDLEAGINLTLAQFDPQLLADHLAKQTKRFANDLTAIELEESWIPAGAIVDTTDYNKARLTNNLEDFLRSFTPGSNGDSPLAVAPKENGSPHTLVITSAGLRAADLTRALRVFQTKEATVAKLFAKHIKLQEAINFAQKTRMCIGVGTPSRISDLLDKGALSSKHLVSIVVDSSHIDQKKRGIFDMKDTHQALMRLLNRPELKSRYGSKVGSIRLFFY